MKLKAAVVGAGGIGGCHIKALKVLEDVTLLYLVDTNKTFLAARTKEFELPGLSSVQEIPGEIDFVTVATPPAAHYQVVKTLLKMGKHVFCEKPITIELAEAHELRDLAKSKRLHLGVGFKMRYEPWFQKAKELIPRIGRLYQFVTAKQQSYRKGISKDWIETTGAMQELSSHDFDLIHYICGTRPKRMLNVWLSFRYGWPSEDGFSLLLEYENGMIGTLNGLYSEKITWTGRDNYYRFAGENGYLAIDRFDRVVLHLEKPEVFTFNGSPNTFLCELRAFTNALKGDDVAYPDVEAGINSLWVVQEAKKLFRRSNK